MTKHVQFPFVIAPSPVRLATAARARLHEGVALAPLLRRLEPRVMFDGAALTTAIEAADVPTSVEIADATVDHQPEAAEPFASLSQPDVPSTLYAAADSSTRTIVFIDSAVSDPHALMAAAGVDAEVALLDPRSNGLTQIADYLEGRTDLSAIHIVSHGEAGELTLSGRDYRGGDLVAQAADLARIGAALADDGDILLYGCSVGAGDKGAEFIQLLSDLTRADVAASTDDTGSAALGGDWDLETRTGFIEVSPIDAPEMHGVLAPLTISASGPPSTNGLTNDGAVGLWTNAGTIGTTAIDIRATVIDADPGTDIQFATNGSLLWLKVTGGNATVRWEAFQSGTGQSVIAIGDPQFSILDIDGDELDTVALPGFEVEKVAPALDGLTSFTTENGTNLINGVHNGQLMVAGTVTQSGESNSMVTFNWTKRSSWDVTYSAQIGWGQRFFFHDGKGSFTFSDPKVTYMLGLDLDANNSTATGTAYQTTFTENGAAVPVVDADVDIVQHSALGTDLASATVTLTNAKPGDVLSANAATLSALGITASVDTSVPGQITLTLSGTTSIANYEAALKAVMFSNSTDAPGTADRVLSISVTNNLFATTSNLTTSTIHVVALNDQPDAVNDTGSTGEDSVLTVPASGLVGNDTDVDGDTLTIASAQNSSGGAIAIGSTVTLPSGAKLTLNADGSYVYDPNGIHNGLDDGETATETFTYTVSDGNGGTDIATVTITINGANDAPAAGVIANLAKTDGQAVSINAGSVFSDPDVEPLSFSATGLPAWLSIDPATGIISGAAPADASQGGAGGVYAFTVTANDGTTTTARSFNLTVTNPPPVAGDDAASTNENVAVTVSTSVLVNDYDTAPDADTLALVSAQNSSGGAITIGTPVTLPSGAKLILNANGTYTYNPNGMFEGLDDGETATDTFTYTISDGQGGTDTATVTITIDGRNDAPQAGVIPAQTGKDGDPVILDLGALFTDKDGEPLTYVISGLPDGLTYDPATGIVSGNIDYSASQNGLLPVAGGSRYVVTVIATDGDVEITRTFNYTVTNPAPAPVNDTNTVGEDGPAATGSILGNDDDGSNDGDPITLVSATNSAGQPIALGSAVTLPSGALLTLNADGTYSYDPNGAFEGLDDGETATDTFTYLVSDGQGGTATATVTITITGSNDVPVAIDNSGNVTEDGSQTDTGNVITDNDGLGVDSDVDGETLTVTAVGGTPVSGPTTIAGQYGTLVINPDGSYTYTLDNANPAVQALGPGETLTETFEYTASDGTASATADLVLTINGTNDLPVAVADTGSVGEDDGPVTGNVISGPGTDSDVDGDTVTVTAASQAGNPITVGQPFIVAGGGVLTLNPDGSYNFDPGIAYNHLAAGETATEVVNYTISDGNGGTATATLTITITGANDAPVIIDPMNPGAPDNPNPAADPLNVIPDVATNDGQSLVPIAAGDYVVDPDGQALTFALDPVTTPAWLTIDPVTGTITGTPPADASQLSNTGNPGEYLVTITAIDPDGAVVTTTLTVTVGNVVPVAVADTNAIGEDGTQASGNVIADTLTGDHDGAPDSDPLTVTAAEQNGNPITIGTPFTLAGGGELVLNPDGSYIFTPGRAYNGLDVGESEIEVVTYNVADGNGGTATTTLTITINGANDAPVIVDPANPGTPENPTAASDPLDIIPDVARTDGQPLDPIAVGNYVVDPDGELLTFALDPVTTPAWLAIDPVTGTITGTPPADASQGSNTGNPGEYLVTVTATDPDGQTVTTTVTLSITNLPPVAADDTNTIGEDVASVSGNVITDPVTGDTDTAPDSDPLTVTLAEQAGNAITLGVPFTTVGGGALTLNVDGSYTFVPGTAYNGLDAGETATETIAYTVSDGNGGAATALLVITVNGANDAPVIIDPANPGTPDNPTPAADPLNIIPDVATTDGAPIAPIVAAAFVVDPDGEPLTFGLDPATTPAWLTIDPVSGAITGTPPADASQGSNTGNPGEYLVTVTAIDPDGAVTVTTVTFTIANLAPVAVADATTLGEDDTSAAGNVIADPTTGDSDTAPDSDPLTVVVAKQNGNPITIGQPFTLAGGGELTLEADGSWSFTPGTAYNGLDLGETAIEQITYAISDGNGGMATATLTLTIAGANDAPVIIDPMNPGTPDNPNPAADPLNVIPDVVTNDGQPLAPIVVGDYVVDPDGEPLTFALDPTTTPAWLSIDPVTGTITGTPPADASQGSNTGNAGEYLVTVTATDPDGAVVTTTLTVTVGNVVPVAVADTNVVGEDGAPMSGNVITDALTGDHDGGPDSDPLTVTAAEQNGNPITIGMPFTLAGGGMLTLAADGSYTFDPGDAYNGLAVGEVATETISYTVSDGQGGTATATLTISIDGANDTPVLTDAGQAIRPLPAIDGTPVEPLDVGQAFRDPDASDGLRFTASNLPPGLTIDPLTGVISGAPTSSASRGGPYEVTVVATDGHGGATAVTFVWPVSNPGPVAEPAIATTDEGEAVAGTVTAHDTDGDALVYELADGPQHGTLVFNADGSYVYTPDVGFRGEDSFDFRVIDADGKVSTATVQVIVRPVSPELNISQTDPVRIWSTTDADLLEPIRFDHGDIEVTYPNNVFIHFVVQDEVFKIDTQYGTGIGSMLLRHALATAVDQADDNAGLVDGVEDATLREGLVLPEADSAGDCGASGAESCPSFGELLEDRRAAFDRRAASWLEDLAKVA